ncbi:MAG: AAA family ATPase [Actinobacteria bacterium]|nr:AAA family ATPase [Actinomycetota bacterium]
MGKREEIAREQAHVDRAYERLDVLRERARDLGRAGVDAGTGSTFQALLDRDVFVYRSALRLAQLELGDEPLVFGRLDLTPEATEDADGTELDRLHIGRIGVPGEDLERLVVDWRAPAAAAFYQATPREPLGVVRRRSILCRADRVLDLEDDLLDEEGVADAGLELVGEGALLAAVTRARSDRMRDIVATIQAEQDRIIRAPSRGILVVQGGPGTGKTAVALHRAAYLLYAERERLERRGVLLVGPTRDLLRYIERVLPSLGEQSVRLRTLGALVDGVDAVRREPPARSRVLGDPRMVEVLGRAVELAAPALPQDERFAFDGQPFTFHRDQLGKVRRDTAGGSLPYNQRRDHARAALQRTLWRGWRKRHERSVEAGERRRYDGDELQRLHEAFSRHVADSAEFLDLLDAVWPRLEPEEVLTRFWGDRDLRRRAVAGHLEPHEAALLDGRDPTLPWSLEDVALLDELDALLGRAGRSDDDEDDVLPVDDGYAEVTTFADRDAVRIDTDEPDLFGHVVVDEAQDLSPMQWRTIARRGAGASFTIVGDLAQASGAWSPASWADALRPLGPRPRNEFELTVNYRTPREVMELAGRVLAVAAPELRTPRSVRDAGEWPAIVEATPGTLLDLAVERTRGLLADLEEGTVAVLAPSERLPQLTASLADDDVRVIDAQLAKGLEFDGVVLCDPAGLVEEAADGLRALYVALTRATQRLVVVHAGDAPAMLVDAPGRPASDGPAAEDR